MMGALILLNNPLGMMHLWTIPLIISFGLYNAILIFQRWKQEKNLDTVYRSTGKAILLTSITIFCHNASILFFESYWFI